MSSRSTAESLRALALALWILAAPGFGAGPELAAKLPGGAEVYLEVADTAGLAGELDLSESRLFQLVQSEGFQGFHESKLGMKLVERFRVWLDRFLPETGTGVVARKLLGGAGALALYDISELRFVYVVEGAAGAAVDGLVAASKVKAQKLDVDGVQFLALEHEGSGFYLRRPGNLLVVSNDRELLLRSAKLAPGTSLADEEGFARLMPKLPAGLARIFVPARTFSSVYMRSYWVGGRDDLPPAAALAACLRKLEGTGEAYEEVRLRDLDLPPPAPAAPGLAKHLPAWTFRELGGRTALMEGLPRALACVLPRDGGAEDGPFARLAERLGERLDGCVAYGMAGGLAKVPDDRLNPGPAPKERLGKSWPPTAGLYLRPRGVLALAFADPGEVPLEAVREEFARYLGELLETEGPPAWTGEVLDLPLVGDLSPALRVVGATLLVGASPEDLEEAARGTGKPLGAARPGSYRQAWVSGPGLAADMAELGSRTHLADDWFGRNLKDFVRLHVTDALSGCFDGLAELALEARGEGGAVEESLRIRF